MGRVGEKLQKIVVICWRWDQRGKGNSGRFSARAWDEARALIWSTRRRGVDLPSLYGLSVSQN